MTKPLKQVSRSIGWFPLCAILVGPFAHDGRAQSSVFPPPSPGARSCSAPGANWLTCMISGGALTLGAASGQASHQVIGTCGSATSFGPCSLGIADLPGTLVTSASSLASTALMTGAGSQGAQTTTTRLSGGVFYPTNDGTTAIQLDKANGSTVVLNVDTTNGRVGIGTASPTSTLTVSSNGGRSAAGTEYPGAPGDRGSGRRTSAAGAAHGVSAGRRGRALGRCHGGLREMGGWPVRRVAAKLAESGAADPRSGWRGMGRARTPAALAELQGGWEMFLQFAMEVGALSCEAKKQLERRSERALAELARRQSKYQAGSDPASHFVALVQAALVGGGRLPEQ